MEREGERERERVREGGREETETNSIPSEWKGGTEGKLSAASHVEKKHLGSVVGGHQKPPFSNVVVLQVWSWASSSSVPWEHVGKTDSQALSPKTLIL